MTRQHRIRAAAAADAAACASIYAHYVRTTAITFETDPPSVDEMMRRIAKAQERHEWLVLEEDDAVIGYAYAGTFNPRAAYKWSCEVSVYLDVERRGAGAGSALYEELLARLARRGFRRAIAGVTQPNPASARLHEKFGFEPVGIYRNIGWKFDGWHDVAWFQLDLDPDEDRAVAPRETR
ncbi:GNAT family N-acetyltransferase [Agreia sp. Leaf283]|uniref:GNAT family N-acetyltransferase n=1 Tax=Agreia sp. Leaf283 TaxID=1736321 RepID=UPI000B246EB1|nr:GNAT family N-acetyltransferase [Agreia sp. Leaf283]